MKNIYIKNWYGRLGNNIIQVLNAILIALYYKYNIILPRHRYFNIKYLILNDKIKIRDGKITNKDMFFSRYEIPNIDKKVFDENNQKALNILRSCFIIKKRISRFKPNNIKLNENDLLIHIRSGDIFTTNPHPNYIMPPLSYYVKIIETKEFNNIYMISEDNKNPCINELLKLYPQIIHKIQSFDDDISLILSAHNIMTSFGTFIHALLSVSSNIKNIYKVSYDYNNTLLKHVNIYDIDLNEYHNLMKPWRNTAEQRKLMLDYKCINSFIKNNNIQHNQI
jgi:hypothetical protein